MISWPNSGAAVFDGKTWHGRLDAPDNRFSYSIDLVLVRIWPNAGYLPFPFSKNKYSPVGILDKDHGTGNGSMSDWALEQAQNQGLVKNEIDSLWLLTQPRRFGFLFNPVSFWFFVNKLGEVLAVLAEVNNTYGDRHSYFCRAEGDDKLESGVQICLPKRFHVSPFQQIIGNYNFSFDLHENYFSIVIDHRHEDGGLRATLSGHFKEMSIKHALYMALKRPFGGISVSGLIHWQALKLVLKGATFRKRPSPPTEDITA